MKIKRKADQRICKRQPMPWVFFVTMILVLLTAVGIGLAAQDFSSYADLANQVKHPVVNIFTTKVIDMGEGSHFGQNSPFEEFFKHFFGAIFAGTTGC
jgi:hypothetical protein